MMGMVTTKPIEEQTINEASEVTFQELDSRDQTFVKILEKLFKVKHDQIFDGIHGKAVNLPNKQLGDFRFDRKELIALSRLAIRWMESGGDTIRIGF